MQNLVTLITCARLSGRWAAGRLSAVRSSSSRVIRQIIDAFEPCRLPAPVPIPVRVPRLRKVFILPALMLALVTAVPAHAARSTGFETVADGRLIDVQVQVDGSTAPLYFPADRSDRLYFQAFRGRHYSLAVTNNTGRRIGVLIAVDGLNVVNGQRSNLASDEAMYVLDPWERTVIRGWRSSLQDVRQFVFVDEQRSYAERTGQANGDMGWIRVMAFNERGQRWLDNLPGRIKDGERGQNGGEVRPYRALDQKSEEAPPVARRDEAGAPEAQGQEGDLGAARKSAPLYNEAPAPQSAAPGTGWGDKRSDPVRRVWFAPDAYATDQIVLRYEYASGLQALGIYPRGSRDRIWEREHGELGFAQPPRW